MNEAIIYKNNKVEFPAISGVVLQTEKTSESITTGGGGKGVLINGTGYIAPITVSTQINRYHSFWIKADDGREIQFTLNTDSFAIRIGHRITVVYGKNPVTGYAEIVGVVNVTTGDAQMLRLKETFFPNVAGYKGTELINIYMKGVSIAAAIFIGFLIFNNMLGIPESLAPGFLILGMIVGFIYALVFANKWERPLRKKTLDVINAALTSYRDEGMRAQKNVA